MGRKISFTVLGEPKAQPRVKATAFAGHTKIYTPGTAKDWKTSVKAAAADAVEEQTEDGFVERDVPVAIKLEFLFKRPKGHFGKRGLLPSAPAHHLTKPDFDNLAKSTVDAMVDCGVLYDDKAIVSAVVTKSYCRENDAPGCLITLEVLE